MHVVVINYGEIEVIPPVVSLTSCLLELGVKTTLLANHLCNLPESFKRNDLFTGVELGERSTTQQRIAQMVTIPKRVREYLKTNQKTIDAIWTATDISARAAGRMLLEFKHIMQISELVEYVPAFANREMPFHSNVTIDLARNAACVVVPEYNRAHIQKTWWDLPSVPMVLPNKPYPTPEPLEVDEKLAEKFEADGKKKLLYQGFYSLDRDLEPYAKAVRELGNNYALYLMGWGSGEAAGHIKRICEHYPRVYDLGFVPAPNHLAYTKYGHIGVLPYVAGKTTRASSLNALYCAPNKIWEYSRFGLPMIGSDVPGLASAFSQNGIGKTVRSVEDIVKAVRFIDADYDSFSLRSAAYFDSIDVKAIVSDVLKKAGL